MKDKDTLSKGPKKRDPTCFEVRNAMLIPAGTILRQEPGKEGTFSCPLAGGKFVIDRVSAEAHQGSFKRVIA
jgi:hypothetical protein